MLDNLDAAIDPMPKDRFIKLMGNHDVWWRDSSNVEYGADPSVSVNRWYEEKYFPNASSTHLYANNVVFYDHANRVKYISITGWDFDTALGGDSHYVIRGEHLDAIIEELEKTDGYDIVLLSHIALFKEYDSKFTPATDGNQLTENTINVGCVVFKNDMFLDDMLRDRNLHVAGTVSDSYKVSHQYDFSRTTGRILCCFAGHEHRDWYGYRHGILQMIFDDVNGQNPTNHALHFGLIDRNEEKVQVWKVSDNPIHVYHYEVPFPIELKKTLAHHALRVLGLSVKARTFRSNEKGTTLF